MLRTNPDVNANIHQTLGRLESMLNTQGRVDFVIHFWKDFSNLCSDGLIFKAVNNGVIPRMMLIPVVTGAQSLGIHQVSDITNRVVAKEHVYMREGSHTVADLLSRFAGHSLVHVQGFNYNVTEVNRAYALFDALMNGLPDNPNMEEVAQYFEIPLSYAVSKPKFHLAQEYVNSVLSSGKLADAETLKFNALVRAVRQSARITVAMGVEPVNGRLPSAIRLINEGKKFRLDGTESWLSQQFPNFDVTSKINAGVKSETQDDAITRLANTLVGMVSKPNATTNGDEVMRRLTDSLPESERPSNWETLSESDKVSAVTRYLNRVNNMTIQNEDVLGMTSVEVNRIDTMTNEGTVLKEGVVTEDQAAKLALENKPLEVTEFQKQQEAHGLPEGGQTFETPPVDSVPNEAIGTEGAGVDPVNALKGSLPETDEEKQKADEKRIKEEEDSGEGKSKGETGDSESKLETQAEPVRCVALTATGTQCKLNAVEGSDKCAIHNK